jgi:hypothetical protein
MFSDTPLPPEEPAGQNPPDGAILDYLLPATAAMVTLEILDSESRVVRHYASDDTPEVVDADILPHPTYWIRLPQELGTSAGHHRFVWDLRHEPPRGARRQFSISAVHQRTPSGPHGPFVAPGIYTVRLTVDGQTSEQPLQVRLDPRVTLDDESLELQTELSMRCYQGFHRLQEIREAIDSALEGAEDARRESLFSLRGRRDPGDPDTLYGSIYATPPETETVAGLQHKLLFLLNLLQNADARPTSQAQEAVVALEAAIDGMIGRWSSLE